MSNHGVLNTYLFHERLAEFPKCANCNRRGRDDDVLYILFEYQTFQLHWENMMTTIQEMGA